MSRYESFKPRAPIPLTLSGETVLLRQLTAVEATKQEAHLCTGYDPSTNKPRMDISLLSTQKPAYIAAAVLAFDGTPLTLAEVSEWTVEFIDAIYSAARAHNGHDDDAEKKLVNTD